MGKFFILVFDDWLFFYLKIKGCYCKKTNAAVHYKKMTYRHYKIIKLNAWLLLDTGKWNGIDKINGKIHGLFVKKVCCKFHLKAGIIFYINFT